MPAQKALDVDNFLVSCALPRASGINQSMALARKWASLPAFSVLPEDGCRKRPDSVEPSVSAKYLLFQSLADPGCPLAKVYDFVPDS